DLNLRPSGYEPDELPGCSTPRYPIFAEGKISYFCRSKLLCNLSPVRDAPLCGAPIFQSAYRASKQKGRFVSGPLIGFGP
ncbi:hypothetical protein, partial [Rhizobium mesosinicum]|uniref:hypothetical protein n=1 Tax=Rhizobium mesosinicum TaxID=335017 RepID=UPI001C6EC3AF